jgi:hypothetical protein
MDEKLKKLYMLTLFWFFLFTYYIVAINCWLICSGSYVALGVVIFVIFLIHGASAFVRYIDYET